MQHPQGPDGILSPHHPQKEPCLPSFAPAHGLLHKPDAVVPQAVHSRSSLVGTPGSELTACQHVGTKHALMVAGHAVGAIAIADQKFRYADEEIRLSDTTGEQPVFTALEPCGSQPTGEALGIDQGLTTNQYIATTANEIGAENDGKNISLVVYSSIGAPGNSVGIDLDGPGVGQAGTRPCCLQGSQLTLDLGRRPEVIGIDEGDERGARPLPTGVACGGYSPIGLMKHLNTWIRGGMALGQGKRGVGRSIIDNDDLQIGMRLCTDAAQGFVKGLLGVVGRDDNAHEMIAVHQHPSKTRTNASRSQSPLTSSLGSRIGSSASPTALDSVLKPIR